MKKFILILSILSTLALAGCSLTEDMTSGNVTENHDNKTNIEDSSNVNEMGNGNEMIQDENISYEKTEEVILNALKDSEWIKENVTMKETCFGEKFTVEQELTFEKLSNDLVIVQAYSYEADNNFGVQVFLVGYKDGKLQVLSMPNEQPTHPGHVGYEIDSENLILRSRWGHQGGLEYVDYKLSNLAFEEINSIKFYSESEYDEEKVNNFEKTYNTQAIDNKLTADELDRVFGKNENVETEKDESLLSDFDFANRLTESFRAGEIKVSINEKGNEIVFVHTDSRYGVVEDKVKLTGFSGKVKSMRYNVSNQFLFVGTLIVLSEEGKVYTNDLSTATEEKPDEWALKELNTQYEVEGIAVGYENEMNIGIMKYVNGEQGRIDFYGNIM